MKIRNVIERSSRPALLYLLGFALLLIPGCAGSTGTELPDRPAAGEAGPAHGAEDSPPPADPAGCRDGGDDEVRALEVPRGSATAGMVSGTIRRGQTLAALFQSAGLPSTLLHPLLEETAPVFDLARLHTGRWYRLWITADHGLVGLHYQLEAGRYLLVEQDAAGRYQARICALPFQWEELVLQGEVSGSLYGAAENAGVTHEAARKFVEIFSWDVDFHRDLRAGDRFRLLVRRKRLIGSDERLDSRILATSITCSGNRKSAVQYFVQQTGEYDYFDPDGGSMRKEFLKAPLEFNRISSRYSKSRLHPVLHRRLPHHGVDYAAPTGTPVVSTADGTVIMAGWDRGGGKMVRIRHHNQVVTSYLHFSRFARGLSRGTRVRQGQIIGYVGSSGLASGPHLDYRIQIDGRYRDPLTVEFPPAASVPAAELERYTACSRVLLNRLESGPGQPASH